MAGDIEENSWRPPGYHSM